jgi:hypothetical protein
MLGQVLTAMTSNQKYYKKYSIAHQTNLLAKSHHETLDCFQTRDCRVLNVIFPHINVCSHINPTTCEQQESSQSDQTSVTLQKIPGTKHVLTKERRALLPNPTSAGKKKS